MMAQFLKRVWVIFAFSYFISSVSALEVESWWENLESLNGLRIAVSIGGWNFWYKEDSEYIYSDMIGSWFSGKAGSVFDGPTVGIQGRFPIWKFVLLNATVSTQRFAVGTGIGIPIPVILNHITPWVAYNLSWTNGFEVAPSFEGGIDFAYKRFIWGFDGSIISTEKWVSLTYGITMGIKLW
jgi:hypothetical protein